ncbi:hypothetical protein AJ80_03113 [Polytolypa hystricis UAMH7299]|uniref:Uncharacterized protein n=1 Tax=Polytolypa hystricis (strain UAMH7299) TaxID=1447883 RepID=A0A2B7YKL1_POLH7|nr:hypothetical protein AJ80_03113 [Polytolypa hystricis UAMH7299]
MAPISRLLPLIFLFIFVSILAFVGFIVYKIAMDVKNQTKDKMEKKNLTLSRDGMTVGVKEMNEEQYVDRSQSVLVNIWNNSGMWPSLSSNEGSGRRKL